MGGAIMPDKQYLDDSGKLISGPGKVYLDDSGNNTAAPPGLTYEGKNQAGYPVYRGKPQPEPSAIDRALAPSDMSGVDPNTLRGYAKMWGEALKGAGAGIKGMVSPPYLPEHIIWNPVEQFKQDAQMLSNLKDVAKHDPNYVAGAISGPALLTHAVSGIMEPAGMVSKLTRGTGAMAEDIEPAINDLKAVAKASGKPKTIGQFLDNVTEAETRLNQEYANTLGPHANSPGPLTANGKFPVVEALEKVESKLGRTTDQDMHARAYIADLKARFSKPLTLDELNRQRLAANARTRAYWKQNDVAQYGSAGSNIGTAADLAISNAIRDSVYPEMDRLSGKPRGYFRDLQQRVGNLFNMQSDARDFAAGVHQKSMISKGSTPMERIHPGGALSAGGGFHGYIGNLPALLKARDPEAAANRAVRAAYSMRQNLPLPPEAMSLPLSSLISGIRTFKGKGEKELESIREQQLAPQ
jgi:hypothetical protein